LITRVLDRIQGIKNSKRALAIAETRERPAQPDCRVCVLATIFPNPWRKGSDVSRIGTRAGERRRQQTNQPRIAIGCRIRVRSRLVGSTTA
jgi:hypothetical protein